MLVHPKLPDPTETLTVKPPPGSYPCNERCCKTCQINQPTDIFKSSSHNKQYKIQGHNTCTSENLIYQLECTQCQAQYIGLTTETLRKRMNNHRHNVKEQKEKPVAIHAGTHKLNFDQCYTTKTIKQKPMQ